MTLRELDLAADAPALRVLDASYETSRVYRLDRDGLSATLSAVAVAPSFQKTYPLAAQLDELASCDWAQVAVDHDRLVGVAALRMVAWNRRAELCLLYVDTAVRQRGIGRALVTAAARAGRRMGARALWVETQTTNAAAVDFYRRLGFTWCGFDASLYDPAQVVADEIALFFSVGLQRIG
jgi:ribosomal protein S18 acetylase RimI-like enzyme